MTAALAQIIALTAYGNAFLRNASVPMGLVADHLVFRSCRTVDFRVTDDVASASMPAAHTVAAKPSGWFLYLQAGGCRRLRLCVEYPQARPALIPGPAAVSPPGPGNPMIEAVYPEYSIFWTGTWEPEPTEQRDQPSWRVSYLASGKQSLRNLQIDPAKVRQALRHTLADCSAFALSQGLTHWGDQFMDAGKVLDSRMPGPASPDREILPEGQYSLGARQLIYCALSAWVFGGMGSWNDLSLNSAEAADTHQKLSGQLYLHLHEALQAGLNSDHG